MPGRTANKSECDEFQIDAVCVKHRLTFNPYGHLMRMKPPVSAAHNPEELVYSPAPAR